MSSADLCRGWVVGTTEGEGGMIGGAGACACERTQELGGRETFVEFYLPRRLPCVKCACAGEPDPKSAELQSTRCDPPLFPYSKAEGSASPRQEGA